MTPLTLTAYTLTSSLGAGLQATLDALRSRHTGLAPCAFETARLATWVGQVPDEMLAPVRDDLAPFDCRNNRLAQLALRQDAMERAVADARLRHGAERIGVVVGTSTSGILQTELAYRRRDHAGALPADFDYACTHNHYSLARFLRAYLGLQGPAAVVSTACSSSAKVFGSAARMIAAGTCDAALVGGADSLCLTTLYGFGSLELLSKSPCRPYDAQRDGISIGEGAGFALLERASGSARGATVLLLGVGESSDAYHMSTPHPEGVGARLAMQGALSSAGLSAEDIDYINLHGTGTRANDASEARAIFDLFGDRAPCSSTKGWTGHLLGACGIAAAIVCALSLRERFLPGSVNTRELDPALHVRYLIDNLPSAPRRVMCNAFGFGGSNCCLVLGCA